MSETNSRRRPLRSILVNIALALISVAVVLVLGEAYLRFTRFEKTDFTRDAVLSAQWTDWDQLLGFVRKPNLHWKHKAYPDHYAPVVSYDTDANGFRNPPGVTQADIAFIGDSFTEGGSMIFERTFPRLVEKKLGTSIVNLARGSYGPTEELTVLWKYALGYSPRTIVWVLFEGNDLTDAQRIYNGRTWDLYLPASTDWSERGTIWFDDIQLHELAPSPTGDDWYYRAAPILDLPKRMPEKLVVGENLVLNGDFTKGASASDWDVSPKLNATVAHDTTGASPNGDTVSLSVFLPASTNLGISQLLRNLKPATPYLLTGYIRSHNVLGPARLEVQQRDGDKYALLRFTPGIPPSCDWTKVRLVFTTPEKPGELRVFLRRPADPPKSAQNATELKLAELWDVATHQSTRVRQYWGLIGTYNSAEYGSIEVGFRHKYVKSIDESSPQGWKVMEEMLRRGNEICRERGIKLLIVYLPIALRVHGPLATFAPDAPLDDYVPGRNFEAPDEFEQRTETFCRELDVPFIYALPELAAAARNKEIVYAPRYDTHLYYRGHEIVASLIVDRMNRAN